MAITVKATDRLRRLLDKVQSDVSDAEDALATLEDEEVKGEDRDQASDDFQSAVYGLGDSLAALSKATG